MRARIGTGIWIFHTLVSSRSHAQADRLLRAQVEHVCQRRGRELAEPKLRQPQRKVLTSLRNHWSGLTLFVDHPDVPMDNNEAERRERSWHMTPEERAR